MFKFEEFPELQKAHIYLNKLSIKSYKKEFRYEKLNNDKSESAWAKSIKNEQDFLDNIYSKLVFDTFVKIKPILTKKQTGEQFEWDQLIGEDYTALNDTQKKILTMLIEEERPYVLPEKYYNDIDRYEAMRNGI